MSHQTQSVLAPREAATEGLVRLAPDSVVLVETERLALFRREVDENRGQEDDHAPVSRNQRLVLVEEIAERCIEDLPMRFLEPPFGCFTGVGG